MIFSNSSIPAPTGAPGFQFVGLVTDSPLISRIVFDEKDSSPSDDNIGYDSIVFSSSASSPVPIPETFWLFSSGLIGFIGMRKKSIKSSVKYS